jgi:hypothetical protein
LEELSRAEVWREFCEYKKEKGHLSKFEESELLNFIDEKRYAEIAERILCGGYCFNPPTKKLVNKTGTAKKRTVYFFDRDESIMLKLLAFTLYRYDGYFSPNCYSFRKNNGVKRAVSDLVKENNLSELYCYKLDIKNYFNSIRADLLLPMLAEFIDDAPLYLFFEKMLTQDKCIFDGVEIAEKRGVMAGVSTAPFLSNVFLTGLDRHFFHSGVLYARYSDDIILFAKTRDELDGHIGFVRDYLHKRGLEINTDKEKVLAPHSAWSFLGVEYFEGAIDLSPVTVKKIKDKIKRKAHALYRWKNRKNAPDEKVLAVMIKRFNKKFFDGGTNDLTWSRWFFPLINTDARLKEVDNYLQDNLRFLVTGRHNKTNYTKVPYEMLKGLGYVSLVNRYYDDNSLREKE